MNFEACALSYTYEVTPSIGIDGISFDANPANRMFTYDFALDATYIQTYTIKAIAGVSQSISVSEFVTWNLVVHYPCTNTEFITVSGDPPS